MKRITVFILSLLLLVSMAAPVFADVQESELEYIDTQKDVVFWVSWDVQMPEIIFIAPDGTEFDPLQEQEGTSTILSDNAMYYIVNAAQSGYWRVRYDKGNNTAIEISVHDYNSGLRVEHFTLGQIDGDRMNVSFQVSGPENAYYNYKISVMVDYTGVEKELCSGWAYTGNEQSERLNLSSLASYSGYMLKLYVWYDDNGTDVFDYAYSDRFAYTNSGADSNQMDYQVVIFPEEYLIRIFWNDVSWRAESVTVAIFEDASAEPAVFDTFEITDDRQVEFSYDPSASQIDVELSVCVNGINAAPLRKTIQLSDCPFVTPEHDAINSIVWPVSYKGMNGQDAAMMVNEVTTQLKLTGDGMLSITLHDDWNDIMLYSAYRDNIYWMIERRVYVDRIAPVLTMTQDYDSMHLEGTELTVSGSALNCTSLTVNGTAVSVNGDGTFSCVLSLKPGENEISVIASDALGNESHYSAIVYSAESEIIIGDVDEIVQTPGGLLEFITGGFMPMIITGSLCLLVIVYGLIFWRKGGSK